MLERKYFNRSLFLNEFAKELVLNSVSEEERKREILEAEKNQEAGFITEETGPLALIQEPEQRIIRRTMPLIKPYTKPVQFSKPPLIKPIPRIPSPQKQFVLEHELAEEKIPEGFNLGKLNTFIRDPRVTEIECPGPGKFILVKSFGRASTTRISLGQEEILRTIGTFSQTAKIPVMGNLFKAAVGNLVMTSVISEIAGTRFVIKKITPFSLYWQGR